MKRISLALLIATLVLTGCLGQKARDQVVAPVLVMSAAGVDGVQADAQSGMAILPDEEQEAAQNIINQFFAAVNSKDRVAIAGAMANWPQIKAWAAQGIHAREVGGGIAPGVAASLLERLTNFENALMKAAERTN
jgi:hypothetical protein